MRFAAFLGSLAVVGAMFAAGSPASAAIAPSAITLGEAAAPQPMVVEAYYVYHHKHYTHRRWVAKQHRWTYY